MKKIISLTVLLLAIITAFAGSPKYDAVYHLISRSYTMNVDGSIDYHFRKELQLNTIATFSRYGETLILYNPEFQKLTINESYTIRQDGSKVNTPDNAFNPSLPHSCTDCERFNPIREMVVTHTALELGATIVLDYTIHSKGVAIKDIMEKIDLYESEPVELYEVSVTLPANKDLYWECSYQKKMGYENLINNEMRTMKWMFSKLPQDRHEQYLPEEYMPTLVLSTLNAQHYLSTIARQNAFTSKTPEIFTEAIADIVKSAKNLADSVNAIRNYIARNVHTNDVEPRLMNHIFASAQTVWNTNCATPIEKDILFHAMLTAAGIPASFGFLSEDLNYHPVSVVLVKMQNGPELKTTGYKCTYNEDFVSIKNKVFPARNTIVKGQHDYSINVEELTGDADEKVTVTTFDNYAILHLKPQSNCQMSAQSISRQRTAPVMITPSNDAYTYTIALPAGANWLTKPYTIQQTNDFGTLNISVSVNGNLMVITRELSLDNATLRSKRDIQKLRKMLSEWNVDFEYIYQR